MASIRSASQPSNAASSVARRPTTTLRMGDLASNPMRTLFVSIFIVAAFAGVPALADRCDFGEYYTTHIRKYADGSFALQSPNREVDANGNIYKTAYKEVLLRGIGYSPTPIGGGADLFPHGDYYTSYYRFLWKKDIEAMKKLGANFVRVWSWDLFAVADHLAFLDELYDKGMYTMIPFQMGVDDGNGGKTFEDLSDPETREQARVQFKFVASTLMQHPAVLGVFVANEPEKSPIYVNQLQQFFSLVNDFAEVMREVDEQLLDTDAGRACQKGSNVVSCGHLISVPMSTQNFFDYVAEFYDNTAVDFWSVQPYFANAALEDTFSQFNGLTGERPTVDLGLPRQVKKLFLSERGRSSRVINANNGTDDEQIQAEFLSDSWGIVTGNGGLGMAVMEYSDEWWKGIQSTLQRRGCPDYDRNKQSDCGFVAETTPDLVIVNEEHLGIYRQLNNKPVVSPLVLYQDLSLKAKQAAFVLQQLWCSGGSGGSNGSSGCGSPSSIARVERTWNTLDRFPVVLLCGPIIIVLVAALIASCIVGSRARKDEQRMAEALAAAEAANMQTDPDASFEALAAPHASPNRRRPWAAAGLSRAVGLPQISPHAMAPIIDHIAVMVARRLPRKPTPQERDDIHAFVAAQAEWLAEEMGLATRAGTTIPAATTGTVATSTADPTGQPRSSPATADPRMVHPHDEDLVAAPTPMQSLGSREELNHLNNHQTAGATVHPHFGAHHQRHGSNNYVPSSGSSASGQPGYRAPTQDRVVDFAALEQLGVHGAIEKACKRYFSACPSERMYQYAKHQDREEPLSKLHSMLVFAMLRSICGTVPHASLFFLRLYTYVLKGVRTGRAREALDETLPWVLQVYELAEQQVISLEDLDDIDPFRAKGDDKDGVGIIMANPENHLSFPAFKRSFYERGSYLAPLANFSFFLRFVLWMWFYAQVAQPVQLQRRCTDSYLIDIAVADALLMTITFFSETYLLAGSKHPFFFIVVLFQAVVHLAALVFLVITRALPWVKLSTGIAFKVGNIGIEFGRIEFEVETLYLIASIILVIIKMLFREMNMAGYGEHMLSDRSQATSGCGIKFLVRFFRMLVLIISIIWVAFSLLYLTGAGSRNVQRSDGFFLFYLPWIVLVVGMLIIHALAEIPNQKSAVLRRHLGRSQGLPAAFWALVVGSFAVAMTEWVVPSVQHVTIGNVCDNTSSFKHFACSLAIVAQWASAVLIAILVFLFLYEGWKLVFGVIVGKMNGVGSAQNANDVSKLGPKAILFPLATVAAKGRTPPGLWAEFIRSMRKEHLISKEEERNALHFVDLRSTDERSTGASASSQSPRAAGEHSVSTIGSREEYDATLGNSLTPRRRRMEVKRAHSTHAEEGRIKFENPEARRRVTAFVTSLRSMHYEVQNSKWPGREDVLKEAYPTEQVGSFSVRLDEFDERDTLPCATVMVPLYQEAVMFDPVDIAEPAGPGLPPNIELLVSRYQSEFALLADELHEELLLVWPSDHHRKWSDLIEYEKCEWLLRCFTLALPKRSVWDGSSTPPSRMSEPIYQGAVDEREGDGIAIVHRVCMWCSMRGQTLARTLRGLENVRRGYQLVNDTVDSCSANDKFQVIVGAQEFAMLGSHTARAQRRHLTQLQREWNFDIVYDLTVALDTGRTADVLAAAVVSAVVEVDKSCRSALDLAENVHAPEESTVHVTTVPHYALPGRTKAFFTCHRRYEPKLNCFITSCVQRPGPLLMNAKHRTQGKAENQFQCLSFARGEVTFALDMNQDFGLEEGFKMPMFLRRYFDKPQHAIVGFLEHCMTRDVSLVGEMQGAAEYAFVTIVNRTLARVLRMRLHYGHPDAFDAVRARIVGGMSKASHNVNLSEDVFAGFESVARNSRVAYCEWLQAQKARDVFYEGTQTFNAKIHQGAAQQMRSRDIYFLCQRLPIVPRFSLLASAFGFYIMSAAFALSIFLYTWSITLFAVSDVRFHRIGVFGGKIAVAWVFQLGYFLVLPLFVENTIRYGIVSGVKAFFRTLIPSLFFHSSALLTGAYHLLTALRTNQGIYLPTGRGFGLEQRSAVHIITTYALSHMWPAALYTVLLFWFRGASPEPSLSYFLRTLAVWFMVLSCFLSVHIFRIVPSAAVMLQDVFELGKWLWGPPLFYSMMQNPAAMIATELRKPSSYLAWRTAVAIDLFQREEKSTSAAIFIPVHFFTDVLTELPVMALLLSYFVPANVNVVLFVMFVVATALILRVALYRVRTAHVVSVFELLLLFAVIVVLIIYFLQFDVGSWNVVVAIVMTVYVLLRIVPLLAALVLRIHYRVGCGHDGVDSERTFKLREKAALCIAFADAGPALIASVCFFVLAFIASQLHSVFTAVMYSGGFVMRLSAYASRRKVTVRMKEE